MKVKRLVILLLFALSAPLFCQEVVTKQTAPRWVFLRLDWNGLGMAPLVNDSAHWQAWHHYPTDTVFNSGRLRVLTSANWIGLSNGLVAFKDTFAVSGPHVITVRDSVILGIVGTGDATTPFAAFTVNSNLPCDVTGWSARWRNGKNRGKVFYICTHDTSAGASVDSLVVCEGTNTWGAAIWANADSIQANDTLELSRGEWAFVVSVLDSSGGGGLDSATVQRIVNRAGDSLSTGAWTVERVDSVGVCESVLTGGGAPDSSGYYVDMLHDSLETGAWTIERVDSVGTTESLLVGGGGAPAAEIADTLDGRHPGAWGPGGGGAWSLQVLTLAAADSDSVGGVTWSAWNSALTVNYATGETDTLGISETDLNTGTYIFYFAEAGYFPLVDTIAVAKIDTLAVYLTALPTPPVPGSAQYCAVYGTIAASEQGGDVESLAVVFTPGRDVVRFIPSGDSTYRILSSRGYTAYTDSSGLYSISVMRGATLKVTTLDPPATCVFTVPDTTLYDVTSNPAWRRTE